MRDGRQRVVTRAYRCDFREVCLTPQQLSHCHYYYYCLTPFSRSVNSRPLDQFESGLSNEFQSGRSEHVPASGRKGAHAPCGTVHIFSFSGLIIIRI